MSDKSSLGTRMKENYEMRTRQFLTRRVPTIIRLDGKAFHTYTKNLNKPFDEGLIEDMQETTKFLCENIQGCKLGYTQSDEITLVLADYDTFETHAWFDYNVQKITSIAASLATAKFNDLRLKRAMRELDDIDLLDEQWNRNKLAFFDARVFQIPEKEEVVNCLIWRQRDAEKNSVAMLAQSLYSHKELHKKNSSDMQEMCFQKGHNWNDLHFSKKRGSFIIKNTYINNKLIQDKGSYKLGDLCYQPDLTSHNYPSQYGRLLEWTEVNYFVGGGEDFVEVPIEKVRKKWEVVETPIFSKNRDSILNLI